MLLRSLQVAFQLSQRLRYDRELKLSTLRLVNWRGILRNIWSSLRTSSYVQKGKLKSQWAKEVKKWFERYNFVAIISGFLIFCKKNDRTRFFRDKLPDNSVHCKCPRSHNYIIIINITKQILIHLSWSPSSPLLRGGWGRSKWSRQRQVLYRVKPSEQKKQWKFF